MYYTQTLKQIRWIHDQERLIPWLKKKQHKHTLKRKKTCRVCTIHTDYNITQSWDISMSESSCSSLTTRVLRVGNLDLGFWLTRFLVRAGSREWEGRAVGRRGSIMEKCKVWYRRKVGWWERETKTVCSCTYALHVRQWYAVSVHIQWMCILRYTLKTIPHTCIIMVYVVTLWALRGRLVSCRSGVDEFSGESKTHEAWWSRVNGSSLGRLTVNSTLRKRKRL